AIELELEAPDVEHRVVGVAIACGQQGGVGVVGLLRRLDALVVEARLHVSPAEGVAGWLVAGAVEAPLGLARANEATQVLWHTPERRRVATLPIDVDICPR